MSRSRWYSIAFGAVAVLTFLGICTVEAHCAEPVPIVNDAGPLFLAAGLDYASTRAALGQPGVRELNPLGQTDGKRIALKAGTAAFLTFGVRKLRSGGHRNQARVVKYGAIALQLAATGWNLRNARRAR